MVVQCGIRSCKRNQKDNKNTIFHSMPRNPEILLRWKDAVRMYQPDFTPSTHTKISKEHFVETDYNKSVVSNKNVLKKDAIPSIFKPEVRKALFNVDVVEVYEDDEENDLQDVLFDNSSTLQSPTNSISSLNELVISESEEEMATELPSTSFSTSPKPKKRKYYVGDFSQDDIESPNSRRKFWHASRNNIAAQQRKIQVLLKKNYRPQQKISNMDQLIGHLKK